MHPYGGPADWADHFRTAVCVQLVPGDSKKLKRICIPLPFPGRTFREKLRETPHYKDCSSALMHGSAPFLRQSGGGKTYNSLKKNVQN